MSSTTISLFSFPLLELPLTGFRATEPFTLNEAVFFKKAATVYRVVIILMTHLTSRLLNCKILLCPVKLSLVYDRSTVLELKMPSLEEDAVSVSHFDSVEYIRLA